MSFRLAGIKFSVSVPFTAIVTILLFLDKTGLASLSLAALFLHEAGHLTAMAAFGVKPSEIRLLVGAIEILRPRRILSKHREIIISLSGSAVGILAGALMYFYYMKGGGAVWANSAAIQFSFAFFNLVPIRGLDGGTVTEILFEGTALSGAPGLISAVTVALLLIFGVLLLRICGGAGMLIAAVYLLIMQIISLKR